MKKNSKPFLFLFATILLVMSFPLSTAEWLRSTAVVLFSPVWEILSPLQIYGRQIHDVPFYRGDQKNEKPNVHAPSMESIPARVIFRSPGTWNSSLWINIGENTNGDYHRTLIAKNSPVLIGNSVVGVIDYVGKDQSRVRLITDSGLVPSVRVARGGEQNKAFEKRFWMYPFL